jgi:hypothetical protein
MGKGEKEEGRRRERKGTMQFRKTRNKEKEEVKD